MKYHFKVTKEDDGFSASCVEIEGIFTQGDNMAELEKNMHEALNLHLSEPFNSDVVFAEPKKQMLKGLVAVDVEPSVAFALILRQARKKRNLTQNQFKAILGFKNLSNYQRLEDPKKSNPELKTLLMINEKVPELKLDLLFTKKIG